MFKLCLFIIFAANLALAGGPLVVQGPWISGITRSSALFSWVTDIRTGVSIVKWGTASSSLNNISMITGEPIYIHSWYATGLPAGNTIYYQICSRNSSDETCSSTGTFNTLSQV